MTPTNENTTNENTNDNEITEQEIIEQARQQWDMAQSILNAKLHLFETDENTIEHTTEEAQSSYEKINAIPIGSRVDVNA